MRRGRFAIRSARGTAFITELRPGAALPRRRPARSKESAARRTAIKGLKMTVPMAVPTSPTRNKKLLAWVDEVAAKCAPAQIYWCDGSQGEYDRLCAEMVQSGTRSEERRVGKE